MDTERSKTAASELMSPGGRGRSKSPYKYNTWYVFSCKIIILSKRKLASKIQEYCLYEKYFRAFLLFKIN